MQFSLKAEPREKLGSSEARRIRNKKLIPAVIYGKNGQNINLSVDAHQFEKEYLKGNIQATVIALQLGNKAIKATINKIETHPVSDAAIHIDFLPCVDGSPIAASPKVIFENQEKSPGIKKGGFLNVILRRLKVLCEKEEQVITHIKIDVGSMHIGEKIRANNISLPEGVKFADHDNFLVASITGRGKSEDDKAVAAAPVAASAPAKVDTKK